MESSQIYGKGIAAKLVKIMADVRYVPKDAKNTEQNYKYASDVAVLSKVQAALAEYNVASIQRYEILYDDFGQSNSGKRYNLVKLSCYLTLIDADTGESIVAQGFGSGLDYGTEKAIMKAQTSAHKYTWMKLLNIPTGDDPEADEEVDREAKSAGNMAQNPPPKQTPSQTAQPPASGGTQQGNGIHWPGFWGGVKQMGYNEDQVHIVASELYGLNVTSLADIIKTRDELKRLYNELEKRKRTA